MKNQDSFYDYLKNKYNKFNNKLQKIYIQKGMGVSFIPSQIEIQNLIYIVNTLKNKLDSIETLGHDPVNDSIRVLANKLTEFNEQFSKKLDIKSTDINPDLIINATKMLGIAQGTDYVINIKPEDVTTFVRPIIEDPKLSLILKQIIDKLDSEMKNLFEYLDTTDTRQGELFLEGIKDIKINMDTLDKILINIDSFTVKLDEKKKEILDYTNIKNW